MALKLLLWKAPLVAFTLVEDTSLSLAAQPPLPLSVACIAADNRIVNVFGVAQDVPF